MLCTMSKGWWPHFLFFVFNHKNISTHWSTQWHILMHFLIVDLFMIGIHSQHCSFLRKSYLLNMGMYPLEILVTHTFFTEICSQNKSTKAVRASCCFIGLSPFDWSNLQRKTCSAAGRLCYFFSSFCKKYYCRRRWRYLHQPTRAFWQ